MSLLHKGYGEMTCCSLWWQEAIQHLTSDHRPVNTQVKRWKMGSHVEKFTSAHLPPSSLLSIWEQNTKYHPQLWSFEDNSQPLHYLHTTLFMQISYPSSLCLLVTTGLLWIWKAGQLYIYIYPSTEQNSAPIKHKLSLFADYCHYLWYTFRK